MMNSFINNNLNIFYASPVNVSKQATNIVYIRCDEVVSTHQCLFTYYYYFSSFFLRWTSLSVCLLRPIVGVSDELFRKKRCSKEKKLNLIHRNRTTYAVCVTCVFFVLSVFLHSVNIKWCIVFEKNRKEEEEENILNGKHCIRMSLCVSISASISTAHECVFGVYSDERTIAVSYRRNWLVCVCYKFPVSAMMK